MFKVCIDIWRQSKRQIRFRSKDLRQLTFKKLKLDLQQFLSKKILFYADSSLLARMCVNIDSRLTMLQYGNNHRVAGWLSGRVLVQGLRGLRFKPLPCHSIVEVSSSFISSSCC